MGMRFRKSINIGGGARLNLSKSGLGFSLGTKGTRVTKKASGGTRSTLSVPGTGISYVKDSSSRSGSKTTNTSEKGNTGMALRGRKKRKTWLWVLGWLCIFPLPLTILLLRKKEMKVSIKIIVLVVAWLIYLLIASVVTSDSDSENTEEIAGTVIGIDDINADEDAQRTSVAEPIEVESISLKGPENDLILGKHFFVNATIVPDNADDKSLTWNTSDESIVTVDQEGNLIAVGAGQATITACSANGVSSSHDIVVDGTQRVMSLRVTHPRDDDNNIGDDWSYTIQINGENPSKDYVLVIGEKLEFYAKITESDDNPDIGEAKTSHIVTEDDLMNGLTVFMDVYVKENGGRNSGKSAHFVVTYDFAID